jgi:hypothetical protein
MDSTQTPSLDSFSRVITPIYGVRLRGERLLSTKNLVPLADLGLGGQLRGR